MAKYAVTIYLTVTDEEGLIEKARKQSGIREDIDVPMALRLLLDTSDRLRGAVIEDSDCERLDGWRVMRNGRLYVRCETLGTARSYVSNARRVVGDGDEWQILDGDGTAVPLRAGEG